MQPPEGSELSDPPPSLSPLPLSTHEIEVEGTKEKKGGINTELWRGGAKMVIRKGLILQTLPPTILLTYKVERGGAKTK